MVGEATKANGAPLSDDIYSPKWAPHVRGIIAERVPNGDGGFEAQWVVLQCAQCGDQSKWPCTTGAPRQRVLQYALNHTHRDVLK